MVILEALCRPIVECVLLAVCTLPHEPPDRHGKVEYSCSLSHPPMLPRHLAPHSVHPATLRSGAAAVAVCLLAATFSGCETVSTVSANPSPVKCVVSVGSPAMMGPDGGPGSFAITTQPECMWQASTIVSWITDVSPASGQGAGDVSFRVSSNDGSSSREGAIVVNGEQARVSQRAPCRFEIAPSSHSIGFGGGSGSVTISTSTDCAWTAAIDVNWISFTSPAAGSGNGTVAFAVTSNAGAQRSGSITVGTARSSVMQASSPPPPPPPAPSPSPAPPPACTYSLSRISDNVTWNDGGGEVAVRTTPACAWTAASNVAWMTIADGRSGTGNGSVSYHYVINPGPPRTGTLTIAGHTYTVVQGSLTGIEAARFDPGRGAAR